MPQTNRIFRKKSTISAPQQRVNVFARFFGKISEKFQIFIPLRLRIVSVTPFYDRDIPPVFPSSPPFRLRTGIPVLHQTEIPAQIVLFRVLFLESRLRAKFAVQNPLTDTQRFRRHFQKFVVCDKFETFFQTHLAYGNQRKRVVAV